MPSPTRISPLITFQAAQGVNRWARGLAEDETRRLTSKVLDRARRDVPNKTGRTRSLLRSGISSRGSVVTGTVESPSEVTMILERGAAPHVIRPRRAKALVFYWSKVGRVVHLPKVNHPGVEATNFLTGALLSIESEVDEVTIATS